MSSVAQIIRAIIADLADRGVSTSPAEIEAIVKAEHPEVFADFGVALAAKGIRDKAREILTGAARSKQQPLPGLDLPSWYTVQDSEGGYRYVPLRAATLADSARNVEVKQQHVKAAQDELRQARASHLRLAAVPGAHDGMLVLDAAEALR